MATLLPCQLAAAEAFVKSGGRQFLSANVGSGKTYVAGECIRRSQAKYPKPALYVTPTYVLHDQAKKLKDCGLSPLVLEGTAVERNALWLSVLPHHTVVCGLEILSAKGRDWDRCRRIDFGIIVIDEADRLTAGASKRNRRLLTLTPAA